MRRLEQVISVHGVASRIRLDQRRKAELGKGQEARILHTQVGQGQASFSSMAMQKSAAHPVPSPGC